jgi:hypothetical protein
MGKYGKKWRRVRNGTKNKQYGGGERSGLPDFSWYKIPKRENTYQIP